MWRRRNYAAWIQWEPFYIDMPFGNCQPNYVLPLEPAHSFLWQKLWLCKKFTRTHAHTHTHSYTNGISASRITLESFICPAINQIRERESERTHKNNNSGYSAIVYWPLQWWFCMLYYHHHHCRRHRDAMQANGLIKIIMEWPLFAIATITKWANSISRITSLTNTHTHTPPHSTFQRHKRIQSEQEIKIKKHIHFCFKQILNNGQSEFMHCTCVRTRARARTRPRVCMVWLCMRVRWCAHNYYVQNAQSQPCTGGIHTESI